MSPGKRGRPFKTEGRKDLELHIRISPEEKNIIQFVADAHDKSVSRCLIDLAIREKKRMEESNDQL